MSAVLAALTSALHNQLFGGAFILAVSGAVVAALHRVPGRIMAWIRRQCLVSVEVLERDGAFQWLVIWLDHQPGSKRLRSLTATTRSRNNEIYTEFSPGEGNHLFWVGRRPYWITRIRTATAAGITEQFTLTTLGRQQAPLRALLASAQALLERDENKLRVYMCREKYWYCLGEVTPRPLHTVILPPGTVDRLLADLTRFRASSAWYVNHGVPWRRGYLLEGPPGTGKTSLVLAVAGQFKMPIYLVNLATTGLSDDTLLSLLSDVPPGAAIVFEDIDTVVSGREIAATGGSNPSTVTFSGLLNALDGIAAKTGVVVFMTTNHAEQLDPALIRPGRIDERVRFATATTEQIAELFRHFYDLPAVDEQCVAFAEAAWATPSSIAELQQLLLRHRDDPHAALAAVGACQVPRAASA